MLVVGVRCTKDKLDWAVIQGDDRSSAAVVTREQVSIPEGDRGQELAWVRKEILELLERHPVDAAAIRVAESGGQSLSPGRCEVEGVVQEALTAGGICPSRHVAVTIRGAFRAHNNKELGPALEAVPAIHTTALSRRDPVVSAVALLPR